MSDPSGIENELKTKVLTLLRGSRKSRNLLKPNLKIQFIIYNGTMMVQLRISLSLEGVYKVRRKEWIRCGNRKMPITTSCNSKHIIAT